MREIEAIRKLAAQASADHPPHVDVTGGVLAAIRRRSPAPQRVLWVLMAGSAAAATTLAILALQAWQTWLDPVTELFSACYTVIP